MLQRVGGWMREGSRAMWRLESKWDWGARPLYWRGAGRESGREVRRMVGGQ